MQTDLRPANVAGARLDRFFHTCAFFRSREEELRIVGPFMTECLEAGEKGIYIVDPAVRQEHCDCLRAAAVPLDAHPPEQFQVLDWHDTYLRDGSFDQMQMLEAVEQTIAAGLEQGYPRTRIVGQMGWALEDSSVTADLLDYEVRVNDVLARTRHPAICVYDLNKLSGSLVMELLRVHPMAIIGGTLYENPFYTPAETMLQELRSQAIGS